MYVYNICMYMYVCMHVCVCVCVCVHSQKRHCGLCPGVSGRQRKGGKKGQKKKNLYVADFTLECLADAQLFDWICYLALPRLFEEEDTCMNV